MIGQTPDDNLRKGYVSASGRRFVSDVKKEFHYTSFETKKLLKEYSPETNTPYLYKKASFVDLEPHALLNHDKLCVSFNIYSGITGHRYVLKDIAELLTAIDENEVISYGKHLEFTHDMAAFSEDTQKIIRFLKDYFRGKNLKDSSSFSYAYAKGHVKQLELSGHEIDEFFGAVSTVYFENSDFRARYHEERPLQIVEVFPPIDLHIEKTDTGITFEASSFTMFEGYSCVYFERRRKLHVIPRRDCEAVIPFLKFLSARRTENELFISEKDLPVFSTGLYPVLEEYFNVSCEGFYPSKYSPDIPKFKIYIDMPDSVTISCDIKVTYHAGENDEETFSIFKRSHNENGNAASDGVLTVKRNYLSESTLVKAISPYFDKLDVEKGLLTLSGAENEDKIYSFIADDIPLIDKLGDVYLSDSIRSVHISSGPIVNLGVSLVSDLLQLSIVPEDLSPKELDELLHRYQRKKKYFRLKNGEVINLSGNEMNLLFSLDEGLGLTSEDILSGTAYVPKFRALFLDGIDSNIEKDKSFTDLVDSFAKADDKALSVPKSLEKVLRDYQKDGYKWLMTMNKNGFGGILADDMGLGKTLQVLAMLLSLKEQTKKGDSGCSLIVCPASLVYNWQHEIQRFTPDLSCVLSVGSKQERVEILSASSLSGVDVVITSYDLLRRDIDLYKGLSFNCMIIDEAQFIKNPTTQVSKAVKAVSASFKAALTGTPIENRLSELWSIFDFCMPGYLFNYKHFRESIETPISVDNDTDALERLKKMISPFVVRRLKKDVLKDLPDKLEENLYAPMAKEQEELYKAHLQRLKMMVDSKSEEELGRDRIVILSELTRLRQICCDPGLIYENYEGGSAKADLCLEMIKSAAESGHKVLLFSQFTSMLERLTALLKKEGIKHYLLTGSTKKEDRIAMVDAFQEDDTPVFCISLKAGGTGLNLTAADIVIHYDHWWNIAVENQATDRAHRIGQKNVVTVYRLIMQNTIEERIILLQNKKKELADQLLNTDSLKSPTLSKEELLDLLG